MANYKVRSPALPIQPLEYDQRQQDQFQSVLRLYFNRLDQYNIQASTEQNSNSVLIRAENLEVDFFYQGISDKKEAFHDLLKKTGLKPEECAFMGDDIVDVPPMLQSGLSITVPAGHDEVKKIAHFITEKIAGYGAVREACDFIMKAQGTYDGIIAPYFK